MVQIIPAVLATTEEQYQADMMKLALSKSLSEGWVHIDFADNIFVQKRTIEPETIQKFPTNFRKEAHLMVAHPKEWIDRLIQAEFERIIIHIEAEDIEEVIDYAKSKSLEVGIALRNETELEKLTDFVPKIDVVMLMGVVPGLQGQEFIHQAIEKMRDLKSKNWKVKAGIDGGIRDSNIKEIVNAGADFVIVGSYLLRGNIEENLENLWVELSK